MEINGKTRVGGLIGNPVEHTLSPLIHNTLSEDLGHNFVYVPFLVQNGDLQKAIAGAEALQVLGLNITVPYKSEVIPYLQEIDTLAEKIGAVNTLVRAKQGFKGYNTDMSGLFRAMQSEQITIKDEEILLLGAGGAARAVAFLCAKEGAGKVYLLNRTLEKAEAVANEVNASFGRECIVPMELKDYKSLPDKKYLAIQGTSVGLYPNTEDAVIHEKEFYQKIHTGYDLIYKPFQTKFMSYVEEAGGKAYNGLKMLLYQGIDAYELWNGVTVSEEEADKIYEQMKKALKGNE